MKTISANLWEELNNNLKKGWNAIKELKLFKKESDERER